MRLPSGKGLFIWVGVFLSILAGIAVLIGVQHRIVRGALREPENTPIAELRVIGEKIAQAVLAKDVETLLRYDRPDLVEVDRKELRNKKSDLYCFLFDTPCITWQGRSVYDVLHNAKKLAIRVQDWGKSKIGPRYAVIFFFDSSKIRERSLHSSKFLCEKGGKEVVAWMFRRVGSRWESAHPPFGAETDFFCSPD